MPSPPAARSPLPALLLLALSCLGFAAAWILVAAWSGRACAWMAILAGLDAALVLRFTRFRQRPARIALAVAGTALIVFLTCWGIAATRIGIPLGLMPWESLLRMGPEFGWLLVRLGTTTADLAWFLAGLLAAALASR